MAPPERPSRRRSRAAPFRPRFTLLILYFLVCFVVVSLLAVLPDLVAGFRQLPPGSGELTAEEMAQAREIARESARGKLPYLFLLAAAATGVLAYFDRLPGLRSRS